MELRKTSPYPWTRFFLAAAVRALRRVNDEYMLSSLPPLCIPGTPLPEPARLTRGMGLEFATEVPVCAAIAHEFRSSNLSSGVWVGASKGPPNVVAGIRNWSVELEYPFPLKDKDQGQRRVDITVQRVDYSGETPVPTAPVLMEAKRVQAWTVRAAYEEKKKEPKNQTTRIWEDANKLVTMRSEMCEIEGGKILGSTEAPLLYLLLWNCCKASLKSNSKKLPEGIVSELNGRKNSLFTRLECRAVDWFPSDWGSNASAKSGEEAPRKSRSSTLALPIKRIIWVALIEVDPLEANAEAKET